MDLDLLAPTGRVVGVVARAHAAASGLNQMLWSGTLSPGIYLLRATATTDEGAAAQAVRPVVVTR